MPRATSEKVGRGVCPEKGCDNTVLFRRSSGGMLTCKCDVCDASSFAPPGTDAHASRMASIAKTPQPKRADPAPAALPADHDPAPQTPPAAPAKAARTPFSLDKL